MGFIRKITKNTNPMSCIRLGLVPIIMLLTNQTIKLILHEGTTKVIKRRTKIKAGEIMFEFPNCVVCHANSFFLGKPIPILSIHDHLISGHTYFIVPLDRLPAPPQATSCVTRGTLLSITSLCSLGSPSGGCPSPGPCPGTSLVSPRTMLKLLNGNNYNNNNDNDDNNNSKYNNRSPFEYVKDKDGRVLMIKVVPEFITRIIRSNYVDTTVSPNNNKSIRANKHICSTPELERQYEQLVRAKDQVWSPKLKTINEQKFKFSPSMLLRLEWKQKG